MGTELEITQLVISELNKMGFNTIEQNVKIIVGTVIRRADLVAYDENQKPYLLVELTSSIPENVSLFFTPVDQAISLAKIIGTKYVLVSNGQKYLWYEINHNDSTVNNLINSPEPPLPSKEKLFPISNSEFNKILWTIMAELRDTFKTTDILKTIVELLIAKICDEKTNQDNGYQFNISQSESSGSLSGKIINLRNQGWYLFEMADDSRNIEKIPLQLLMSLVSLLQGRKILERNIDKSSENFPKIFDLNKDYKGFPEISNFITTLFSLTWIDTVIDPCVGSGDLLLSIANKNILNKDSSNQRIYGFERDPDQVNIVKLKLLLYGLSSSLVLPFDFLNTPRPEIETISKEKIDYAFCFPESGYLTDVGSKNFDLYSAAGGLNKLPLEFAYMLSSLEILNPNGFGVFLIPDTFLSVSRYARIREFMLRQANILAVISISGVTRNYEGKISLLIFRKKSNPDSEKKSATLIININLDQIKEQDNRLISVLRDYIFKSIRNPIKDKGVENVWVEKIEKVSGFRLDFSYYAPEFSKFIFRLENGIYPVKKLGEICEIRVGDAIIQEETGVFFVISQANIKEDGILSIEPKKFTDKKFDQPHFIKPGDILLGSIGYGDIKTTIVPHDFPSALVDTSIIVLNPKDLSLLPEYFVIFLKNKLFSQQVDHISAGTTRRRVTRALLSDIRIPLPDVKEQQSIIEKVRNAEKLKLEASRLEAEVRKMLEYALEGDKNEA